MFRRSRLLLRLLRERYGKFNLIQERNNSAIITIEKLCVLIIQIYLQWIFMTKIWTKLCIIETGVCYDAPLLPTDANDALPIPQPYKRFLLEVSPDLQVRLKREEALLYYRQMFLLRRAEQRAAELYKQRLVRGFCHLYSGQEAVAVGMMSAMRAADTLITSYRCHVWLYLLGASLREILAELMGRLTGVGRGKGGSMHMYTPACFGGNGIVAAQVPLGIGSAFAHAYQGTKGICYILYGDGAANQGQVFESFNLAKLLNLPAVFVCENNKYGMGTADYRAAASIDFYKRGSYIPGLWVDGMDILAVREATRFAVAHILAGKGPIILEHETYRYFGHSMSDPGTSYRSREEIQKVRASRDPITKFKQIILKEKLVTANELKAIEKESNKLVDDAEAQAKKDPVPNMDEMASDVYRKPLETNVRGVTPYHFFKHKNIGKPFREQK